MPSVLRGVPVRRNRAAPVGIVRDDPRSRVRCGDDGQEAVTITGAVTSAAERPATSPTETPCIPTELSLAAVELVRLYEELHTFKDDIEFIDMGFSQAGPYYAWMQAVERHRDENPGFEMVNELGFLPGEVLMLGMSYMGEDFSESDLAYLENTEGRFQAGLAAARCTELGSVQETIQATLDAMRAYIDPMSRPSAAADDFDERVVNPCIAAMIARNPELDGVTPWGVRNIYPEIYDPLVTQMRDLAAPFLAEFGDTPRTEASFSTGSVTTVSGACAGRDPWTGPKPKSLNWSEAEVLKLLSISQEPATQSMQQPTTAAREAEAAAAAERERAEAAEHERAAQQRAEREREAAEASAPTVQPTVNVDELSCPEPVKVNLDYAKAVVGTRTVLAPLEAAAGYLRSAAPASAARRAWRTPNRDCRRHRASRARQGSARTERPRRQLHDQHLVERWDGLEVEAVEAFDGGEPGLPDPPLGHPAFAVDQFQFSEADEIAHMAGALGGALAGQLAVLAQKGRQLQGLEVMDQQQLRRIGHDAPPPNRLI